MLVQIGGDALGTGVHSDLETLQSALRLARGQLTKTMETWARHFLDTQDPHGIVKYRTCDRKEYRFVSRTQKVKPLGKR
jgi:hypothetical protein